MPGHRSMRAGRTCLTRPWDRCRPSSLRPDAPDTARPASGGSSRTRQCRAAMPSSNRAPTRPTIASRSPSTSRFLPATWPQASAFRRCRAKATVRVAWPCASWTPTTTTSSAPMPWRTTSTSTASSGAGGSRLRVSPRQSLVRRVAHAGPTSAGNASIGVVRRQSPVHRRGHDVHRAGQSRPLDKGRQRDPFRPT